MHYVLGVYDCGGIMSVDCVFCVFQTINKTVRSELILELCTIWLCSFRSLFAISFPS